MELAEIGMSTLQTADSVYLYLLVTLGARNPLIQVMTIPDFEMVCHDINFVSRT